MKITWHSKVMKGWLPTLVLYFEIIRASIGGCLTASDRQRFISQCSDHFSGRFWFFSFTAMTNHGIQMALFALTTLTGLSASLQCQHFCQRGSDKFTRYANYTVITFCQLWEDEDAVIDPAIELGLEMLEKEFAAARVHFEWVKADLPGGCTDET